VSKTDTNLLGAKEKEQYHKLMGGIKKLNGFVDEKLVAGQFANTDRIQVRKNLITVTKSAEKLIGSENVIMSDADKNIIKKETGELKKFTDFAPFWVVLMIALSIGLGTMVGWKRIVVTIGEKIGKNHLTYAQGASAELVAASTIGLASYFKLPVSTTHVLSSGIAGTMVAQKGVKNLQPTTVKTILLAWVLTLPFTIIVAASLFVLFRTFAG
jgi:PiT family inorganic phosphate transporter